MIKHQIYQERLRLGRTRQKSLESYLEKLDEILKKTSNSHDFHPFDNHPEQEFCNTILEYAQGAHWIAATNIDHVNYMYRLDKYASIIKYNPINPLSFFGNLKKDTTSLKENFEFIIKSFIDKDFDWIPLSELISSFSPSRNFSWWTNECLSDIIAEDFRLITNNLYMIHSCGIANDWIKEKSLIMRCRLDQSLKDWSIKIPSVIDAYPQPIFNPSNEFDPPHNGKAIKLANKLESGFNEYVIRNLPIDCIEFKPVKLNELDIYAQYPETCLNEIFVKLLDFHKNVDI